MITTNSNRLAESHQLGTMETPGTNIRIATYRYFISQGAWDIKVVTGYLPIKYTIPTCRQVLDVKVVRYTRDKNQDR